MTSDTKKRIQPVPLKEFEKRFSKEQLQKVELYQEYFHALDELRRLREEMGISQKELSERSGIPQETISRIESGRRNVTLDTLISIASAMGKKVKVNLV